MADHDVDPTKAEEDRLMRAVSRSGKQGTPHKPVVVKKAEEPKQQPKKETAPAGAVPAWKKAQMEKEEAEHRRREEESKKKQEQAKLIEERVKEFGVGANQEDNQIETYLTSPRGQAEKPQVETEKASFEDPLAQRAVDAAAAREEELVRRHLLSFSFISKSPHKYYFLVSFCGDGSR